MLVLQRRPGRAYRGRGQPGRWDRDTPDVSAERGSDRGGRGPRPVVRFGLPLLQSQRRRRCPLHPPPRRKSIRVAPHHVRECASSGLSAQPCGQPREAGELTLIGRRQMATRRKAKGKTKLKRKKTTGAKTATRRKTKTVRKKRAKKTPVRRVSPKKARPK